ncbi:MAG: PD-(D/E)XK nuclease family protein [Anaerolineae bacterium]|nr:PD-(D/E)XK nuclease family protein [Anaerolineae bacterium]
MTLPTRFTFSQSSLQDYVDCARRFQLRYVRNVRWPVVERGPAGEWEQRARQGAAFHRLVQQHEAGIPRAQLDAFAEAAGVVDWWQTYLRAPPQDLPTEIRRVEIALTAPLAGYRLTARYDLLAVDAGQSAAIVDWKTGSAKQSRAWLERRMQTLVYRWVLAEAGASVTGGESIAPRQVSLLYWFAGGRQPERFSYSAAEHAEVGARLAALVREIAALPPTEWPLTDKEAACAYCAYQTLCGREGAQGEDAPEPARDEDVFDVDLEQIAEIEF